jgi:broad specificity phosphatase PhoE
MKRLIIVRHGETIENELNICQGQEHGSLSEKGTRENEKLGLQLKQFSFQTIYSSPLNRALKTAETIQLHNPGSRIITDKRLMERHLGVLQGKTYPQPYLETDLYDRMETIESVAERINIFLTEINSNHFNEETIVLVSHGYVIKVLLSLLRELPLNEFYKISLMSNSSYIAETFKQAIQNS